MPRVDQVSQKPLTPPPTTTTTTTTRYIRRGICVIERRAAVAAAVDATRGRRGFFHSASNCLLVLTRNTVRSTAAPLSQGRSGVAPAPSPRSHGNISERERESDRASNQLSSRLQITAEPVMDYALTQWQTERPKTSCMQNE